MASTYTLSVSKKNLDVDDIMTDVVNNRNVKATDYLSDAVRFYEKYKDDPVIHIIDNPDYFKRLYEVANIVDMSRSILNPPAGNTIQDADAPVEEADVDEDDDALGDVDLGDVEFDFCS